ncbi:uncharacterized protein P174DRAFT_445452 [Aspergillus novofumigatus IBT 16806]|uniref:Uncharacterized protein n=1 Tax=Aspergillus novofumigatus (strain IBT 16806) TaxID=1392255 RepID=A0A2I1BVX8_ASPN1|nr:uncharacterized protein P174DRAFT_445452 [Aspergillus novofumigatus IBT 16806]PKX89538.1 hypothetical protein P174DRAFT_445452 [Aspergillus novofumigatus IBT 16806]
MFSFIWPYWASSVLLFSFATLTSRCPAYPKRKCTRSIHYVPRIGLNTLIPITLLPLIASHNPITTPLLPPDIKTVILLSVHSLL